MAIKDLIGPSFVGTSTIKWIVTRGLGSGSPPVVVVPDMQGLEYTVPDERAHFLAQDNRSHHHVPDNRHHYLVADEDT